MFQVSKKAQYGLRAMVYLAKKNSSEFFSLKDISEKEGMPFDFLEKIMSELEKNKLVKAKKGIKGGYALSYSPNKISVKDIVASLEGGNPVVNCSFCKKSRKCAAKNVWQRIDNSLNKALSSIKLSKII